MARRSACKVVSAVTLVLLGCSSVPVTDVVVAPESDAEAVDAGLDGRGHDALDALDDVPSEAEDASEDAAVAPTRVALYPTPAEAAGGTADDTASTDAVLVALAAGANGLVLDESWDQFTKEVDGAPEAWAHIEAMASFLRAKDKQLLFSLSVVDASTDSRPAVLQEYSWESASTSEAMRDAIDRIFDSFGRELAYLSFGMEVDRYLASHEAQAASFVAFIKETLNYARTHPNRPPSTEVGLTWSAGAWSDDDAPDRDTLANASDVVMLAYYGLDGADQPFEPSEAVAALRAVVDSMDRPVVLHRMAYTTSPLLGSSEAAQATFVTELLDMVGEHRGQIPFVGFAGLHDPAPTACLRFAQARDLLSSAELYAYWCSVGLRDRQGIPKDGFSAFISAASGLD